MHEMIRQVHISELFRRTRAAVSMMFKRHSSIEEVLKIYTIREIFRQEDRKLSRRKWLKRINERKKNLINRAKEIEKNRKQLRGYTKTDSLSKLISKIIDEIIENFFNRVNRLRRRRKILFYNECRSLVYKALRIHFNQPTREHFHKIHYRFRF